MDVDPELAILQRLCERVGSRIFDSSDGDDFLGWHGGTMEYWVHALVAAEARRLNAWASRTETPYITRAMVQSARGEKWSDGAIAWSECGFGALVEAKALVAHTAGKIRTDVRSKVAPDLDAMLGIDQDATLRRRPGRYEDPEWSERRADLVSLYALQIVLVHATLRSNATTS